MIGPDAAPIALIAFRITCVFVGGILSLLIWANRENGSGASTNDPAGTVTLKNTIYRRHPASAATTDGGGNLILTSTGNLAADLTTLGLDPTGLQNNGGPTKTFKLLGGAAKIGRAHV